MVNDLINQDLYEKQERIKWNYMQYNSQMVLWCVFLIITNLFPLWSL